jgi:transposase-like protein
MPLQSAHDGTSRGDEKTMGQVIQIDEAPILDHLGEMVRGTIEETLNAMLDAEADRLCGAGRYERSQARQDIRSGSCERTLYTKARDVSLKIPKLRRHTFETAIIERYRRRESSRNLLVSQRNRCSLCRDQTKKAGRPPG